MNKIIDYIVSVFLKVRRYILVKIFKRQYGKDEPTHLKNIISITEYDSLRETDWFAGQKWGEYHPAGLHQYWFSGDLKKDELIYPCENGIGLKLKNMPKSYLINGKYVDIPYRAAILQSSRSFSKGFFKFKVSVPYGKGLWPAIWLSGSKTWPPEIDILESYSDNKFKYKHESNLHIGADGISHINVGAQEHNITDMNNATFSCWYEPSKFIKIYYDGYLVRKVTSVNILMWYQIYPELVILINTGCREEYAKTSEVFQKSDFIIKSIEVSV